MRHLRTTGHQSHTKPQTQYISSHRSNRLKGRNNQARYSYTTNHDQNLGRTDTSAEPIATMSQKYRHAESQKPLEKSGARAHRLARLEDSRRPRRGSVGIRFRDFIQSHFGHLKRKAGPVSRGRQPVTVETPDVIG